MSTEHAPLPWTSTWAGEVLDAHGLFRIEADSVADAEFIVRACNSHDALVQALKAFLEKWPDVEKHVNGYIGLHFARTGVQYAGPNIAAELDAMRAALAQVEASHVRA